MAVSGTRRFLIGGVGGLAPVFAFLLVADLEKNLSGTNTLQAAGYLVRVLALFAIGGFITWLHETEDKAFKLFEIGLGAPALLAGLITTKSIIPEQQSKPGSTPPPIAAVLPLPSAHAQDLRSPGEGTNELKTFRIPKAEGANAFWRGLYGAAPKNTYYVIAGSHRRYEDAARQKEEINAGLPQFKAEVYAPYGDNPYYGVVIGAELTKEQATALRSKAVQSGLSRDTYVWTFPSFR
jgi:hypothetical protein